MKICLLNETGGQRSAHRVFESHEAVAHPAPGGAVPADVREGLVVVAIGGAE